MKTQVATSLARMGGCCLILVAACGLGARPAWSGDFRHVPYESLGLSGKQAEKIDQLESNWKRQYEVLSPQLKSLRQELIRLLSDPRSDPLAVTLVQQKIARVKAQLDNAAMLNYLGKRDVLDAAQKRKLSGMLERRLAERRGTSG